MIHTDAGVLGANKPSGDVDFWPNSGINQPGCALTSEPLCDHQRSWKYFAETVASFELLFFAVKCETFVEFKKNNCNSKVGLNNMGIDALLRSVFIVEYYSLTSLCFLDFSSFGNYYLQTNSKSPYSRGMLGIRYNSTIDIMVLSSNKTSV